MRKSKPCMLQNFSRKSHLGHFLPRPMFMYLLYCLHLICHCNMILVLLPVKWTSFLFNHYIIVGEECKQSCEPLTLLFLHLLFNTLSTSCNWSKSQNYIKNKAFLVQTNQSMSGLIWTCPPLLVGPNFGELVRTVVQSTFTTRYLWAEESEGADQTR